MPTTKLNSKASSPTPATTTSAAAAPAKPRAKKRLPPVVERMAASASVAVPATPPTATPPPAAPPGAPAPGAPAPASPPNTVVAAPPPAMIPGVPAGFVPANPADLRGFRVLASQVAAVPGAITELQGFSSYGAVFGITAPDVSQLTQRLSVAYDWTMLLSQTAAWYKYARSQHGMAWKDALLLMDALKPPFDLASTANPALLSQYPAIARLLGAKGIVAKRAAAARAKNKKVAAQDAANGAAASATTAEAPAPAAGASPVAAEANGAPAAPARIVTVQG